MDFCLLSFSPHRHAALRPNPISPRAPDHLALPLHFAHSQLAAESSVEGPMVVENEDFPREKRLTKCGEIFTAAESYFVSVLVIKFKHVSAKEDC